MQLIRTISGWLANIVGTLGVFGIIIMMIHITCDVSARLLVGSPLIGTNEIVSRYYMVAVTFLPLAWVEYRNGMISVEVLDSFLSPFVLTLSNILVALASILALAIVAWAAWFEAIESFGKDAFVMAIGTRIPVWPTYFFVPIGCALAGTMVLMRLIAMLMGHSLAGDPEAEA